MRRRVLADTFDDRRSASAPIVETGEEREVLARLISRLERIEQDPKLNAVIPLLLQPTSNDFTGR